MTFFHSYNSKATLNCSDSHLHMRCLILTHDFFPNGRSTRDLWKPVQIFFMNLFCFPLTSKWNNLLLTSQHTNVWLLVKSLIEKSKFIGF
jgi:hypothetical protein